ncbi:MAG TPA: prepilin peptidase [Longimicrobiaceae bacterium]|jgi:prepilin peptidase CpaA
MLSTLTTSVLVVLVVIAAASDLRTRRIPNLLTVGGFVLALALRAPLGGSALADGFLGAGAALLLGVPLFAMRALGGGDVKLLAAVGAFAGWSGLLPTLAAIGIMGGVLGLVEAVRRGVLRQVLANTGRLALSLATFARYGVRTDLRSPAAITVPYGVAIAAGAIVGRLL